MKLPVDLSTAMWGIIDRLAKLSSTVLMTTVMGNFFTSFASMDDHTIFMNITALGILVITIIVDVCIQIGNFVIHYSTWAEEIFVIICMLVLFIILSFSALTVPTTKRSLELKYGELHKKILSGGLEEAGKLTVQELKDVVGKYWIMAETGGPQFVMARSVTCAASGAICLLTALTLVEAEIRMNLLYSGDRKTHSTYAWSIPWIVVSQFTGVAVGTIAPTCRWFTSISFKCSKGDGNSYPNDFKVENYWIQRLVEWKKRPLALRIRDQKLKNLFKKLKRKLKTEYGASSNQRISESETDIGASTNQGIPEPETGTQLDLSDFVLQLESEVKVPKRILKNICHDMNQLIETGKRQQPKNLLELLQKSYSFKGVAEFDSGEVSHTYSEEPPNCWTLPVVTLTSIAIALPTIGNHMVDELVLGVREGLLYARLIEKTLSS
ncbi:unnamed protein product [Ilex paraguariensis]|uniref:Uncharacterized protein n=1 Tax=Ilex paraguariensis TaxID=185542 RepID=A0ABC8TYP0_9AQUA